MSFSMQTNSLRDKFIHLSNLIILLYKNYIIWFSIILVIISIYISFSSFYPGIYTADSADQLGQAINEKFTTWHPPIMAWVWSKLIKITGYDDSIFFFNIFILLLDGLIWIWLFKRLEIGGFSIFIPIILASPIIINFSGAIWNDVGFTFSMLLAFSVIGFYIYDKKINYIFIIILFLCIFYAIGVRHNGASSILPILIFFSCEIIRKNQKNFLLKSKIILCLFSSFILLIIIFGGIEFVNFKISKSRVKTTPFLETETWDLAGISKISGFNYYPKFLSKKDFKKILGKYNETISIQGPCNADFIFNGKIVDIILENKNQLRNFWIRAIISKPIAYIKHRLNVTKCMIEGKYTYEFPQKKEEREKILQMFIPPSKIIFSNLFLFYPNFAKKYVYYLVGLASGTFIYTPWFWLVLLSINFIISLFLIRKNYNFLFIILLTSSGLFSGIPLFLVSPAADFRYFYWTAISGAFSTLLTTAFIFKALDEIVWVKKAPDEGKITPYGSRPSDNTEGSSDALRTYHGAFEFSRISSQRYSDRRQERFSEGVCHHRESERNRSMRLVQENRSSRIRQP